mgnify:CR=1 FL=1
MRDDKLLANAGIKKGDTVLVRDFDSDAYKVAVFVKYSSKLEYPYNAICNPGVVEHWRYCIPYEGHEELVFGGE